MTRDSPQRSNLELPSYADLIREAPLLQLPSGIFLPALDEKHNPFFRHTIVQVGYREVFGQQASWADLESRLAKYSFEQVVDVLSRVDACLASGRRRHGPGRDAIDGHLIVSLLGASAHRAQAAKGRLSSITSGRGQVFTELQLLTCAKVAALLCRDDDGGENSLLFDVGHALLMCADLLYEPAEASTWSHDDRLMFLLANGWFHHTEPLVAAIARSDLVFRSDRVTVARTDAARITLRDLTEQCSGLSSGHHWASVLATQIPWRKYRIEQLAQQSCWFNPKTFWSDSFSFTDEEVSRMNGLVVSDTESLREAVRKRYSATSLRPFDVLPFARFPIVQFGERAYCLSSRLHEQKLGSGILHSVLDPIATDAALRERYLSAIGDSFGAYARDLLREVFPGQSALATLVVLDDRSASDGASQTEKKSADAMLVYPSGIVVLEFKATRFKLEARYGSDFGAFEERAEDLFDDAAAQIDASIDLARSGGLTASGVMPVFAAQVLPVLVTLETIPMNPLLHAFVQTRVRARGLLAQQGVSELAVIDISDFEQLLNVAVYAGRTVLDVLRGWLSSDLMKMTIGHYLSESYRNSPPPSHLPLVQARFAAIAEAGLSFMISRVRAVP